MKKKTKILQVIGGGEFGGAEQHLMTLLRNFDKDHYEVEVACLFAAPLAGRLAKERFPHKVFPMTSKRDFKVISSLAEYLQQGKFDIVHTHGVRANLVGRLAAKRAGLKAVVTTVHSVLEFDYPRKLDLWINKVSERLTVRYTKQFIAVSEDIAKYIVEKYRVSKRKVSVVHNGLELSKYLSADGGRVRKEFGLTDDHLVLSVISRLHPVKGHTIMFYALQHVIKAYNFVRLLVVGSGPEKENLEKIVDELGLAKYVIFTGFRRDIPDVLSATDILVQPSISEGFGLTVIEGMAMNRPVIASAVGGIPEIIKDRFNGLLVTPGDPIALSDAIISLVELPGRTAELVKAGRETVLRSFTAEKMARNTEQVYAKLVSRHTRTKDKGKKNG